MNGEQREPGTRIAGQVSSKDTCRVCLATPSPSDTKASICSLFPARSPISLLAPLRYSPLPHSIRCSLCFASHLFASHRTFARPPSMFFATADKTAAYYANVCRQVHVPACDDRGPDQPRHRHVTTPMVVQVNSLSRACYVLGGLATMPTWSLSNPLDPNAGFKITYTGGDKCGGVGARRKVVLNFMCAPHAAHTRIIDESESPICNYQLTIVSPYACPSSGWSHGWVLVIIFVVVVAVYGGLGTLYNMRTQSKEVRTEAGWGEGGGRGGAVL